MFLIYDKTGFVVGANGTILSTIDGGATWLDQETNLRMNLYAVSVLRKTEAIAVGEQGAVLRTLDAGKTWEIQPNVTSKSLQAVVYRGGTDLWVAGRGGAILKRSQTLSTIKTTSSQQTPPILRNSPRPKPKLKTPVLTITDDGDIPLAVPPKKEKDN